MGDQIIYGIDGVVIQSPRFQQHVRIDAIRADRRVMIASRRTPELITGKRKRRICSEDQCIAIAPLIVGTTRVYGNITKRHE